MLGRLLKNKTRLAIIGGLTVTGVVSNRIRVHSRQQALNAPLIEFEPGSVYDVLSDTFQTGDIIMFKSPILAPTMFNTVLRILRRMCAPTDDMTHIGIIICNEEEDGFPYVLEQTFDKIQYLPLDHRVLLSQSSIITIRRLEGERGKETIRRVNSFVNKLVNEPLEPKTKNDEDVYIGSFTAKTKLALNLLANFSLSKMPLHHSRVYNAGKISAHREHLNELKSNAESAHRLYKGDIPLIEAYYKKYLFEKASYTRVLDDYMKSSKKIEYPYANFLGMHIFPDAELVTRVLQEMKALPETNTSDELYSINNLKLSEYHSMAYKESTLLPMNPGYQFNHSLIFWTTEDRMQLRQKRRARG